MDCCRVCMGKNVNMIHLFDTSDIVDKIFFCTGVKLTKEDGLPTKICNVCFENLSIAYKFKTLCLEADGNLRNVVKDEKEKEISFKEVNDVACINKGEDLDIKQDLVETNDVTEMEMPELKLESKVIIRKSSRVKLKVKKNELTAERVDIVLVAPHIVDERFGEGCIKPLEVGSVGLIGVVSGDTVSLDNVKEKDIQSTVCKKRGPYNKTTVPKRLRKFKFRKLYCEPCDLKFTSKEQSDEHKKDTHKSKDSFVCEICGKTFIHRASHYTHVRSHLPPQHKCGQCDYRTWHKHDLVKHLRIHTGVKMYQCEYCTASYHTSSNLTCHIRRCHMRERRHRCHLCERSFYDRTKLNRHLDSHNDIKRFECDVCHACFTRRCYWKKHLQRQHGIIVPPQRPGRQKTNRQVGEDRPLAELVT